jgi:ribosome biogenesis GTPase
MNIPAEHLARLRRIGWPWAGDPEDPDWRNRLAEFPDAAPARVVEQHRTGYVLADAPETGFRAESLPQWQRRRFPVEQRAVVGDWVLYRQDRIVALLPRRTVVKRAAAGEHYQQQLIAANVDVVFVVCGLDADFNPRRIERYLLLVRNAGAQPVVVLTKSDRIEADVLAAHVALAGPMAQGVPVAAVDAHARETVLAALAPWLHEGCTVALVGSSGAGKSTLINTLLGECRMKTGMVRAGDSRGRHTTTHRALMTLPGGGCLIDTPGMRELKPTGEESLSDGGFADIDALAKECRFRDCMHQHEPGCALRTAAMNGALDPGRLANYLKLRAEIGDAAGRLAARAPGKARARSKTKNTRNQQPADQDDA